MNPEKYDQLLDRLLDDPTDAEAAAELNAALRTDSELRRHYLSTVSLYDALASELGQAHDPILLRQRAEHLERIGCAERRRLALNSLLAAAACLLLALVVFTLVQSQRRDIARITPGTDAVFAIDRQGRADGLRPGDTIIAKSGRLRIELQTGVSTLVEGPAHLRLEKKGAVSLEAGRAWFDAKAPDADLTVHTPLAQYRDIGTTFGIALLGEGEELSVTDGVVEVAGITVKAGQHLQILANGKTKLLAEPAARYVKSLTDPVKPHLHWSFDTPDPATATGTHSVLGALKARFEGEPIVIPDGKFGSALRFNDSDAPLATKWQGVTGETPRTVAAWIRVPSGVSLDGTICMWGDPSDKAGLNRKWKLTLNRHANLGPSGALRLTTGSGYQIATSNLTDGKWHHVAVVLETGWPRLYVDGRRESGPLEIPLPINTAPDGLPLIIGGPHHTAHHSEAAFTGDIDEFWVFEAALSSTEIEILSRTNSL